MRVLAVGECMVEFSPWEKQEGYGLGFAGDTYNTAWYLTKRNSELNVAFYTAVGNDDISQRMMSEFAASGIESDHVQTVDDATVGLYLISLDNGERSFSYWREQSAAKKMMEFDEQFQAALDASDLIYFSGITLAILGNSQRAKMLDQIAQAKSQGKIVVFDPNLRLRLWSDADEMTQVIMQGARVSNVALPSFEDEANWFRDATPMATADRYSQAGADIVIVKNGGEPVFYWENGKTGTVAVKPLASVVDTTAAGDSFNAEILAGIATGEPLERSIESACNLASLVIQGRGALVAVDDIQLQAPSFSA